MGLNEILLVVAALVPAIVLLTYVYKKDRADKEPARVLALLFICGVIICFPAGELEGVFGGWINSFFAQFGTLDSSTGTTMLATVPYTIYQFVYNTLGIAFVEEGLKWIVLYFIATRTKHFNGLFDGIIYAVFVSLGFAAFENVLYVLNYGWVNAIIRAVLSVPGHMFFAVAMGYFFTRYYISRVLRIAENEYRKKGIITKSSSAFLNGYDLALSIIIPVFCHGLYDFCLSMDDTVYLFICLGLVILLYIYCFSCIKDTSRNDTNLYLCVLKLLEYKYPGIIDKINGNKAEQSGTVATSSPAFTTQPGTVAASSPVFTTQPTTAKTRTTTTTSIARKPGVKFAGVYAQCSGVVNLMAGLRTPIAAGETIATIRTASGAEIPVVADYNGRIDKYNVVNGHTVSEHDLIGVIKYDV